MAHTFKQLLQLKRRSKIMLTVTKLICVRLLLTTNSESAFHLNTQWGLPLIIVRIYIAQIQLMPVYKCSTGSWLDRRSNVWDCKLHIFKPHVRARCIEIDRINKVLVAHLPSEHGSDVGWHIIVWITTTCTSQKTCLVPRLLLTSNKQI
jgi:hypothetical protein